MHQITLEQFLFGMGLTLFAGLSTGIGSCIIFFLRRTNFKLLAFLLGLSGGMMVYISLVELMAEARRELVEVYGQFPGAMVAASAFFGGILAAALIDRLIPETSNPHEPKTHARDTVSAHGVPRERLMRCGLLFALAIGLHNLPEGMAVFVSGLEGVAAGVPIAVAIAIHNIPEGITVSVPVYQATGNRKKAFWWSFLSGLAEPVGALLAAMLFLPFLTDTLLHMLFAGVAGVMVFISFDELLPMAEQYGEHHWSIYGLISGMFIMAFSLSFGV